MVRQIGIWFGNSSLEAGNPLDRGGFPYHWCMKEKAKSQSTEEIGRRLRELRERLNKNQAEMGRLLGLRKDAYGKYERQNSHPPFKVLSALATRYNVSLDYLFCGRGTLFYGDQPAGTGRPGKTDELSELLDLMEAVPFVRYSMLSYFQRLKSENRQIIDRELGQATSEGG